MGSTMYFEVLVLVDVLFGDVLRNDVIGHGAGTAAEVSSGPQVSSPELLLKMRGLHKQMVRRSAFEPLHQAVDCHFGLVP
jgi:hypothetical protein